MRPNLQDLLDRIVRAVNQQESDLILTVQESAVYVYGWDPHGRSHLSATIKAHHNVGGIPDYRVVLRLSAGDEPTLDRPESGFKQAFLQLWGPDQNPVTDPPREAFGIMQETCEQTVAYAGQALRSHWNGQCGCQKS